MSYATGTRSKLEKKESKGSRRSSLLGALVPKMFRKKDKAASGSPKLRTQDSSILGINESFFGTDEVNLRSFNTDGNDSFES